MASRHPIRRSLELLFLMALLARAQTAEDFFHGGAMNYLSNNVPAALTVVTNGLQQFPDDEKLKKLYELLNQQQQQSQDNQQQENKSEPSKNDQQKQPDKQDQPKNEQQKPQDQKREQEKQQQQPKSGDKKEQKPEPAQARPAQMTPQQAQRLLDSQKGTEQVLWFKPEGKPDDPNKPHKDW